jgi:hypothetical protein
MKTLLLFLLLSAAAFADTFEGDLYAIDAKASTVTLSAKDKLQTYRVRPDTEVKINGVKAKFSELNTTMTAKVISSEPQVASKIEANGVATAPGTDPAAAGAAAVADFEKRLAGTKWNWSGFHFAFEAGGKSSGDRHFTWKTVKPNTITYEYADGFHGTIVFERGLTHATLDAKKPDGTKETPSLTRDKP